MCRITTYAVVSMLALAVFGVEQIPQQKDYGSLVYVAAHDSCATDKARADVVCDGTNAAPAINARRRGPTADRPTSMTDLGFGYFDTDLNRIVWRTEAGWSE